MDAQEIRDALHGMYGGENKVITDNNYDQSLAVKCINGTFVGKKAENIISYKGIPFVGQQPVVRLITMGKLLSRRLATPQLNMEQARTACT